MIRTGASFASVLVSFPKFLCLYDGIRGQITFHEFRPEGGHTYGSQVIKRAWRRDLRDRNYRFRLPYVWPRSVQERVVKNLGERDGQLLAVELDQGFGYVPINPAIWLSNSLEPSCYLVTGYKPDQTVPH